MRLLIAAIGKLKDDEERSICDRYAKRIAGAGRALGLGPLDIQEFSESRAASVDVRKAEEAERLIRVSGEAFKIALDVEGQSVPSEAFARMLSTTRQGDTKTCAFLIGGPDGHGNAALKAADIKLSLGAMTLPHGLARVVLVEQIYRAITILTGHPYHRT